MERSPCHIVLAEDNPADVRLVRVALHEHAVHCDLRVISDGEEVLSLIRGLERDPGFPCPDLLLLDLHLPKRDGREILRELRSSGRCNQTPVVILTSSDAPWDHRSTEEHAALYYFRKPTSLVKFMLLGKIVKDVLTKGEIVNPTPIKQRKPHEKPL